MLDCFNKRNAEEDDTYGDVGKRNISIHANQGTLYSMTYFIDQILLTKKESEEGGETAREL